MSAVHYLGVDLGTSSVKAVVVDADGRAQGSGAAGYGIARPAPGHAEQDVEDWWRAAIAAVRQALGAVAGGDAVQAIGLGGQMHGTVLLDEARGVLAPAVIWSDQRSRAEAREIDRILSGALRATAGGRAAPGFQAASLRWLQRHAPELWSRVRTVLLPKDWLRLRMTGELGTDPSDAAGTMLLDVPRREWSAPLLGALGVDRELLPEIRPATSRAGTLTAAAAAALGLRAGTPVIVGAADTACSALAAGVTAERQLLVTISSGGQVVQPAAQPRSAGHGRVHTFCSALEPGPGRAAWYRLGAILSAGSALSWLRDNVLGLAGPDAASWMDAAAAQSPPGARGLLFLPYLEGERTPHMDPAARAAFVGLTARHGRPELVRAVLEGVGLALADACAALAAEGPDVASIVVGGGGSRSALWRQILADILGLPLRPLLVAEQSACGAALLAAAGSGAGEAAELARRWVQLGSTVAPDPRRHALYCERLAAYRALYAPLRAARSTADDGGGPS